MSMEAWPARRIILGMLIAVLSLDGCRRTTLRADDAIASIGDSTRTFVWLGRNARFSDSSTYVTQGVRTPNGRCGWLGTHSLAKGERVSERLVAYDPKTCELVIANGSYTPRLSRSGMRSNSIGFPR